MKRALILLLALLPLGPVRLFAQTVPLTMNYQGRLAKPDGTPVPDTTTQSLTVRLFANVTGGTALWAQTFTNVIVHNGTFSVALDFSNNYGSFSSFATTFNTPPYLETQVGSDAPLSPRQVLRSVAYAFTARTALTVPDGSITGSKFAPNALNFASVSGTINSAQFGAGVIGVSALNSAFGPAVGKFSGADWLVSSTPTANGAFGVSTTTIGGVLYAIVANGYANSFQVFNVANPAAPTLVSTTATDAYPRIVLPATIGGTSYLFVSNFNGNTIGIYNIANPAAPTRIKTLTTGANPFGIALGAFQGSTYLYVTNNGSATLQTFNVTAPASALFVNSIATGAGPISVATNGATAYVACFNGGVLQAIGSATTASPVVLATISGLGSPASVSLSGVTLAVACYSENTVRFYNASSAPVLIGVIGTGIGPYSVVSSGPMSYVACFGSNEADAIDISSGPRITGIFPNQTQTNALAYSNGLLYVTSPTNVLNVINPANLASGFAGAVTLADSLNVTNTLNPDYLSRNRGTLAYGIRFGAPISGEGIGSNRADSTAGSNQNGLDFYTGFARRISITNAGRVGVGTANPAYPLDVVGDINASGVVRANGVALSSDARFKTGIATIPDALEDVLKLRGVSYDFDREKWPARNFPEGRQFGFIAQEMEQAFPELVTTDAKGFKSVNYIGVVPVLVEAVKTLKRDNEDKQRQIEELRAQIKADAALKARLDALEALVRKLSEPHP